MAFIDESGYPIPTDPTDRPTLVAVCMRQSDIRAITGAVYNIKRDTMGDPDWELKGVKCINPRVMTKYKTRQKLCVEQVLQMLRGFDVRVFSVIMDKPELAPEAKSPDAVLPFPFRMLIERVDKWARLNRSYATCIFDTRADSKELSKAFLGYLYRSPAGQELDHILELPLFVDSETVAGIQLADICASIVRHHYEIVECGAHRKNPGFVSWVDSLYTMVHGMTSDIRTDGGRNMCYGFYRMPIKFQNV